MGRNLKYYSKYIIIKYNKHEFSMITKHTVMTELMVITTNAIVTGNFYALNYQGI